MTPWNLAGGLTAVGTIAASLIAPGIVPQSGATQSAPSDAPVSIPAEPDAIVAQFAEPLSVQ